MLQRNDSIDVIKGFLIICVICGHALLGTIDGNIVRYLIYSFHMPLFMFMSGYMINLSNQSKMSFRDICCKYWNRMIKAWLVAFVVFSVYQLFRQPTLKHVFTLLYSPWYHLWYIPTLFIFIIISRFIFVRMGKRRAYFVLIAISLIWFLLDKTLPITLPRWFDFKYLPYFALGLFFKNHYNRDLVLKPNIIFPVVYILSMFLLKLMNIRIYGIMQMFLLLIVVVCYVYPVIKNDMLPKSNILSFIGKNSLMIYLWHELPIIIFRDYVSNDILYYGLIIVLFITFIIIVKLRTVNKNICR